MRHILHFFRNYNKDRQNKIVIISVLFLIWSIAFAIFEYFAPLYLDSLNINYWIMGIILAGSSFISLIIDPFLGYLQRKFPPRALLVVSIILFAINVLLFLYSKNSIFLLFLATNIYGIAFDLFSITTYKTVFDNSLKKEKATNISFLSSFYNLGLLLGSLIAGFVVAYNLNNAAYLCLGILLLLLIVVLYIGKEKILYQKLSLSKGYSETFNELKNIGFMGLFLIFILIFINTWDGFFFVFEPIFAKKFSGLFLNELIIGGILLAIYCLPSILFARTFGKLEDKYGKKWFIVFGLLLSGLFIFILQMTDNIFITAASIFLLSLGSFAIVKPATECLYESIAEKKFGKKYTGNYAGVIEITLSLGFLLGPLIGGFFLSYFGGFNIAFQIFSIVALIIAMSTIFIVKEK